MFKKIVAVTLLAALPIISVPMTAHATTITFDGLDATASQPLPLRTFTEAGYTFELGYRFRDERADNLGPVAFDTTCASYTVTCNGDPDLFLDPSRQGENGVGGNVLILQSNIPGDPVPNDDRTAGGIIIFRLLEGPSFRLMGASAIDDVGLAFFTGRRANRADWLGLVNSRADNGTASGLLVVNPIIGVGDSFTVRFTGSGGLDSLILAPVPLPAGALLLLSGLGGLTVLRRRSTRAAA